jgi:hypothetical protein
LGFCRDGGRVKLKKKLSRAGTAFSEVANFGCFFENNERFGGQSIVVVIVTFYEGELL